MSHVNTIPWTLTDAQHISVQTQPGTSLTSTPLRPRFHQATGLFQEVPSKPGGSASTDLRCLQIWKMIVVFFPARSW